MSQTPYSIHGPELFEADDSVQDMQQWLEETAFRSRCVDENTNKRLPHVQISTSCGMVLDSFRNLHDYPVSNRDTLTVILVPVDDLSVLDAEVRDA